MCAVVGDEHGAVSQKQESNRPAPNFFTLRIEHPPGQKIIVTTDRFSILETNANDLVSGAFVAVPGTMQCHKSVTTIFRWEHPSFIKGQSKNCRVGLDQYVARQRFLH